MDIVIGPVLKRSGGYSFDVWTAAKGLTRGVVRFGGFGPAIRHMGGLGPK